MTSISIRMGHSVPVNCDQSPFLRNATIFHHKIKWIAGSLVPSFVLPFLPYHNLFNVQFLEHYHCCCYRRTDIGSQQNPAIITYKKKERWHHEIVHTTSNLSGIVRRGIDRKLAWNSNIHHWHRYQCLTSFCAQQRRKVRWESHAPTHASSSPNKKQFQHCFASDTDGRMNGPTKQKIASNK